MYYQLPLIVYTETFKGNNHKYLKIIIIYDFDKLLYKQSRDWFKMLNKSITKKLNLIFEKCLISQARVIELK